MAEDATDTALDGISFLSEPGVPPKLFLLLVILILCRTSCRYLRYIIVPAASSIRQRTNALLPRTTLSQPVQPATATATTITTAILLFAVIIALAILLLLFIIFVVIDDNTHANNTIIDDARKIIEAPTYSEWITRIVFSRSTVRQYSSIDQNLYRTYEKEGIGSEFTWRNRSLDWYVRYIFGVAPTS